MQGQVFITQGDITRLGADAVAVTSGFAFSRKSPGFAALAEHAEGYEFEAEYVRAKDARAPGKPYWVPCHDSRAPLGVVFVTPHARTRRADASDPAYVGVQEAITTAAAGLRAKTAQPVLVALIGFRMGEGGDREDRLRSARAQVRAAYDALAELEGVDVAFVLDDASKYEIFLDARRRELKERDVTRTPFDPRWMPLVEAIKNDECVLFVGAGLSLNAHMPSYRKLIEALAQGVGITEELASDVDSYLDIAQAFRDQGKDVEEVIAALFGAGAHQAKPSLAHYLLLSMPIRLVITTNYDHLLEETLEALRRYPLRVVDQDDIAQTGYRDGNYVVKFHGDAEDGNVVLSRDDYDGFFTRRPEMASLLEGLLLNQTFFFLGYSLRDPNFRQIYSKIDLMLRTAKRPAFATTLEPVKGYVREQYARKQLRLVELGPDAPLLADAPPEQWQEEREQAPRRLLAFLDRLAEEVSEGRRLFLAREAAPTSGAEGTALTPLAEALALAGDRLVEASAAPLTPEEVRIAARTLAFLSEHGWRPKRGGGVTLTGLWRKLAENLPTREWTAREKRQLLTTALRYADDSRTALHLRKMLAAVPSGGKGDALGDAGSQDA